MGVVVRAADRPGDLGWMVWQHGEVYAATLGWDTSFEALVARIVADFASADPDPRLAGWIAELDGRRVGSVLCVREDEQTALHDHAPVRKRPYHARISGPIM